MDTTKEIKRAYLHLTPEMQRALPESLDRLLVQEGVTLPDGVSLSRAPMSGAPGEPLSKDLAVVINVTIDLTLDAQTLALLIGTLSGSAAAVILAISRYLKDRGHTPRVVTVDDVVETTAEDGTAIRQLSEVRRYVEPGPQIEAELQASWKRRKGVAVDLRVKD